MPELSDITVYTEHLKERLVGQTLERVRLLKPFVLRSVAPPIAAAEGRRITGVQRMGELIVIALEGGLFLALHPMIAGRLRMLQRRSCACDRLLTLAGRMRNISMGIPSVQFTLREGT